jgi:hypothetical protein
MTAIRNVVVLALLAVWSFPAVSLAKSGPDVSTRAPAVVDMTKAAKMGPDATPETQQLAAREKQAQDLQSFKGGDGVYLYFGSGAVLVLIIILLILL